MLPELPHTSAVELQLTLLYQRLDLLNGLIGHLEAYQVAPEMPADSLQVDPPVPGPGVTLRAASPPG